MVVLFLAVPEDSTEDDGEQQTPSGFILCDAEQLLAKGHFFLWSCILHLPQHSPLSCESSLKLSSPPATQWGKHLDS